VYFPCISICIELFFTVVLLSTPSKSPGKFKMVGYTKRIVWAWMQFRHNICNLISTATRHWNQVIDFMLKLVLYSCMFSG